MLYHAASKDTLELLKLFLAIFKLDTDVGDQTVVSM